MKTFLIFFFLLISITISSAEARSRRQIWPPPPNPNSFGLGNFGGGGFNQPDFYDDADDSWGRPSRPQSSGRGQNGFQTNDWLDGGRNENGRNQNDNRRNQNDNRRNQNDNRRNQNDNRRNQNDNRRNQNQNVTEEPRQTSLPRPVHTAPQGCTCPFTPQYNPVCGTDGRTYKNAALLNCHRQCGTNVSQKRLGAC